MKTLKFGRLAGLMLAAAIAGAPMAAPVFAQEAPPAAAATTEAPAPAAAAPAEAAPAAAAEAAPAAPTPDKGDTTWMMVSMILVLMMIIPGLALFYGGLVRSKNMLSMLVQVTTVASIGILCWVLWGYSLAFTNGGALDDFVGGLSKFGLNGAIFNSEGAFTNVETFSKDVVIPELIFVAFQATFAAITGRPGAGRRRRADEVPGRGGVRRPLAAALLLPHGSHGLVVGRRDQRVRHGSGRPDRRRGPAVELGRAGLRRRHRGAHQRRYRGPGRRPDPGQAHGLSEGADAAA